MIITKERRTRSLLLALLIMLSSVLLISCSNKSSDDKKETTDLQTTSEIKVDEDKLAASEIETAMVIESEANEFYQETTQETTTTPVTETQATTIQTTQQSQVATEQETTQCYDNQETITQQCETYQIIPQQPETESETQQQPGVNIPNSQFVDEVIRLVNIERANAGVAPLVKDDSLCQAAYVRSQEIVSNQSHTRPDGSSCFTVLSQFNISYRTCGENIAWGQRTPEQVVNSWMNSQGHRENILNSNYGKIGVGLEINSTSYGYYWTQLFTN